MAVRIEQPQPFAPGVAFGYGASEVQNRNNPVISDAYQSTARLQTQVAQANAERASRERMQALDQAQRQTEADYRNAQQGMIADAQVDLGREEMQDRRQGRIDQMTFQSMRDQFAAAEERAMVQRRAEAAAWVNQQDMTFKDVQDLRKREAAVSHVMSDPTLTPDEKAEAVLALRAGISRDQQRLQASQAKMLQQRAAQYESEVRLQSEVSRKQALLDAKTIPDRTEYMLDPAVQQQVEQEMPPTPDEARHPAAMAHYRRRVASEVARRGGLLGYMVATGYDQNGKAQFAHQEFKKEAAADPVEQMGKALKVAEALARAAHPPEVDALSGKEKVSPEYHKEVARQLQTLTGGGGGQPGGQGQPAGGEAPAPRKEAKPFDPYDRGTMDRTQAAQVQRYDQIRVILERRTDLPPADQQRAIQAANLIQTMLGTFGSFERMTPQAQRAVDEAERVLRSVPDAAPATPAAPAAPPRREIPNRPVGGFM